jgi:hypothetical protein
MIKKNIEMQINNTSHASSSSTSSSSSSSSSHPIVNKKPKQQSQNVSAKVNDYRKNTKPLMEKRRRERINRSLEELKNLILDQTSHNNVSYF